jgi:hypothetical protein
MKTAILALALALMMHAAPNAVRSGILWTFETGG